MSAALTATIGWSTNAEGRDAGAEAGGRARDRLLRSPPKLALVFGSSWLDQAAMLSGVREALPGVTLAGISTSGEILPDGPVSHSCVVMLLAADTLPCRVGAGEAADRNPREAGRQAAFAAGRGFQAPRTGFLLFGDGLVAGAAETVRGVQEVVGTSSLIAGGLAGDDQRYACTYQYANDRALTRGASGVLLGRPVKIGVGLAHGFAPISRPRRVTRSQGQLLLELDHLPAASVYEEYFGRDQVARMRDARVGRQGVAYPLGIRGQAADEWLLRTVVAFGDGGSLACSGDVQDGDWLQLMIGSRELILDAARRAALSAVRGLDRVAGVIVLDSVVRKTLLGPQHAAMEIARIRQAVGASTPLAGCYTYGAQATLGGAEHRGGQTGSVLVIAFGE